MKNGLNSARFLLYNLEIISQIYYNKRKKNQAGEWE